MEITVADKLINLLKLQEIDSTLDRLIKLRGDLPDEVQDLEDEMAGYETRIGKFQAEIGAYKKEIESYINTKKEADALILKYKDQQMDVRNNREFEAINNELELQHLEIQLADKRIKEAEFRINQKQTEVDKTAEEKGELAKELEHKKSELEKLISDSHADEEKLIRQSARQSKKVEDRLLKAYTRIRGAAKNGLAVVEIDRGACGGCFNVVPPQRQADIMEKQKIIVCEHCGRILADAETIEVHRKRRR